MTRLEEVQAKLAMVREFMSDQNLDAVALNTRANFAWLTAGGMNHVGLDGPTGVGCIVVTRDTQCILTNNIEAGRIEDEETGDLPFEIHYTQWDEEDQSEMLGTVASGTIGADARYAGVATNVADGIARLRWQLMPPEIERYRSVGAIGAAIIAATCQEIAPGMTEHEIAGLLTGKAMAAGCQPVVALIAADERAMQYRHPISTDNVLDRHVMVVLGCTKWGLGIYCTRMVSFGEPSAEMRDKHAACCTVDACMNLESVPGASAAEVFSKGVATYAAGGYPDEWRLHHQGGGTGYAARDYFCTAESPETVLENQAFAWNPSITGTKSEDTIIARSDGPEYLTVAPGWPTLAVEYEGVTVERMDILVR